MLTAKVGKTIINCFDSNYDRYTLKQWSNKNILKCPVCNDTYEYCHGEVIDPYFRHKEKDCSGYYSEPETDEHRKGKILLYNWIKQQDGIKNCELEAWIPETKQRPDIYFEYLDQKFIIEYQCTPIASEFIKRRELYSLNGITDIWILGTDKYNLEFDNKGNIEHGKRYKTIEKELNSNGIIYFDVNRKILIFNSLMLQIDNNVERSIIPLRYECGYKKHNLYDLYKNYKLNKNILFVEKLSNFSFCDGKVGLNDIIMNLLDKIKDYHMKQFELLKEKEELERLKHEEKMKEMELEAQIAKEELQRKIEEKKKKLGIVEKESEYIGATGEEININVLLIEEIFFWTYGSTLYKFIDKTGNLITWMTSTDPNIKIGDFIEITGKVKSHSEYEDIKQTRLIRCKVGAKVR